MATPSPSYILSFGVVWLRGLQMSVLALCKNVFTFIKYGMLQHYVYACLYVIFLIGEISLTPKHPIVYEISSLEDIRIESNISPLPYFKPP